MPPIVKKRGCPRGAEKTVIGLPCKKVKKHSRPMAFLKKNPLDRDRGKQALLTFLYLKKTFYSDVAMVC